MEFQPDLPAEGQLVKIPIKSGTESFITGTITLATASVKSTTKTLTTTGISYAELRLVGLEVEMSGSGPSGCLPGFVVLDLQGSGKIPALYGPQTCLADAEGFPLLDSSVMSFYARLVVIGLRDKAEIEKTNTVTCQIKVFANSSVTGTFRYLLRASGIFNRLEDDPAESSD